MKNIYILELYGVPLSEKAQKLLEKKVKLLFEKENFEEFKSRCNLYFTNFIHNLILDTIPIRLVFLSVCVCVSLQHFAYKISKMHQGIMPLVPYI